MQTIHLQWIDYTILVAYVAFVLGIGWTLARYMKTSSDFLTSARSIPTWVTGLAFISANLGALELVGMAASGAKYGIATAHFYWVGAIPAMIFLAVFMMPFYYGSKARSVPEYLKMRFDERVRALNSVAFAVMFAVLFVMHPRWAPVAVAWAAWRWPGAELAAVERRLHALGMLAAQPADSPDQALAGDAAWLQVQSYAPLPAAAPPHRSRSRSSAAPCPSARRSTARAAPPPRRSPPAGSPRRWRSARRPSLHPRSCGRYGA